MNRTEARKTAVGLISAARASGRPAEELLDDFFDEEYYSTLSSEDSMYAQRPKDENLQYIRRVVTLALDHESELGEIISANARGWKENRISKVTSAILRCALSEILYMEDIPEGASVKDAVDITKCYADERTANFVNAVLRSYLRSRQEKAEKEENEE